MMGSIERKSTRSRNSPSLISAGRGVVTIVNVSGILLKKSLPGRLLRITYVLDMAIY